MSEATLKVRLMMILSSILLPAFAFSQGDTLESWPETKQRMIERGKQYETAWAFYQSLESMAEDKTLDPEEVPDWTGLWGRVGRGYDTDRNYSTANATTAVLKGEYAVMYEEVAANADAGFISDPHSGCGMPRGYPGMLKNGRPHEFAVTPHQTWHMGQARNEVRRIYTDGRGHTPEDWAYPTEHGDSIGYWDGDTLVTHTMHTNGGWIGRVMPYFSEALESIEIWRKVGEETIQADVWLYDDEALEEPWYTRQVYTKIHQEEGSPLRLEYWWNCWSPNNMVTETDDGGTTFTDFDFTDMDDVVTED